MMGNLYGEGNSAGMHAMRNKENKVVGPPGECDCHGTKVSASMLGDTAELTFNSEFPDHIAVRPICQRRSGKKWQFRRHLPGKMPGASAIGLTNAYSSARMTITRQSLNSLFSVAAGVPVALPRFLGDLSLAAARRNLNSQAYPFETLTVHENGPFRSRAILTSETHGGFALDLHESELPAGKMPHPPHQHPHEELLLIREGQIDITIAGKTTRLSSGSAAYIASNELHGWRNTGARTASYFVMALGDDK
jgi:mannose-6-phosphate isomerase-like protein (cupin superfamily)